MIDANVVPRYLTNDPQDTTERAAELFDDIVAGRTAITDQRRELLSDDDIVNADNPPLAPVLTGYREHDLGVADARLAVRSLTRGATEIISFDRDIDRLPGVVRREPMKGDA